MDPLIRAAAVVTVAARALASCTTIGDNPKAAIGGLGGATVGGLIAAAAGGGRAPRRPRRQLALNALFIDFDKADTDHDGSLTFEEIEVYARSTGR